MEKSVELDIINNYFKEFDKYKRLSIVDAKELYDKSLKLPEEERYKIRNIIINGTMYKVRDFIKNSLLYQVNLNDIDIEDLINDCIIIYIDFIDNGGLVNLDTFSPLFCRHMYMKLNSKYKVSSCNKLLCNYYNDLVMLFYVNMNTYGYVKFDIFYDYCKGIYDVCDNEIKESLNILFKTYDLTLSTILKFKNIVINSCLKILYENNISDTVSDDIMDKVLNGMLEDELFEILDELKPNHKYVLCRLYGIRSRKATYQELADELGVGRSNIQEYAKQALNNLYSNYYAKIKKLRLIYEEE